MESTVTTHQKNLSTFIHLSTFSKWFIPFGNLIAPIILWSAQKNKSQFVEKHGRNAINFQLSILIYTIAVIIISVPFFIWQAINLEGTEGHIIINDHFHTQGDFASMSTLLIIAIIVGAIVIGLVIFEIINVISAAIKASNGNNYKYPLSINFIKASTQEESVVEEDIDITNTTEGSKSNL